jgi:hypothetical protein
VEVSADKCRWEGEVLSGLNPYRHYEAVALTLRPPFAPGNRRVRWHLFCEPKVRLLETRNTHGILALILVLFLISLAEALISIAESLFHSFPFRDVLAPIEIGCSRCAMS